MNDSSINELNSQLNKIGESQIYKESEKNQKEEKLGNEIIKELKKIITKTKFYKNVNVDSFVDNINENTMLINDYSEKEKKSFVFYNLMITCQINGLNLHQNNLFSDFFFAKDN